MKINNTRNTLQRSSAYEKKTLEERIKKLLQGKKEIIKNREEANKEKIIDDLYVVKWLWTNVIKT